MMIRSDTFLEKFLLLPFSMGCKSSPDVVLADNPISRKTTRRRKGGKDQEVIKNEGPSKASSLSQGFHRFIRRFKTFSQFFFVYKQELEHRREDQEMEIGFPTDVKHVTHIGLDGSTTTINPIPKWADIHDLKAADATHQIQLSFPSISLQQFELAMAAQSNASN